MQEPIVINGSHGEGGGALLRTALVMSALTQIPLRIHNIRGALRKPGLNSEDLLVLAILSASCRAEVEGDDLGSLDVRFAPSRPPRAVDQRFDIGAYEKGSVSGSAPVVVESVLPVLIRAGAYSRLSVLGETHGQNTLGFDAFERSALSAHRAQGVCAFPSLVSAGYGTGAVGEMRLDIEPSLPNSVDWSGRGDLVKCGAVVSYSDLSDDIAARGVRHLRKGLVDMSAEADIEAMALPSKGAGISVTVFAEYENGRGSATVNGQRGVKIENVVDNAIRAFEEWVRSGASVDPFLADQMLLLGIQAQGKTVYSTQRVTRRLTTMVWVSKQFMPLHMTVKGAEGFPGVVSIENS